MARKRDIRPRPLDLFRPLPVVRNIAELVFEDENGVTEPVALQQDVQTQVILLTTCVLICGSGGCVFAELRAEDTFRASVSCVHGRCMLDCDEYGGNKCVNCIFHACIALAVIFLAWGRFTGRCLLKRRTACCLLCLRSRSRRRKNSTSPRRLC